MSWFMIRETLGMAARALIANRLRSLLALLGIVIGVGTVIGMVALINGFQRSFKQSIQSFGNNTIYTRRIRPGIQLSDDVPDSLKQRKAFSMDDARVILASAPAVRAIAPFKWAFQDIKLSRGDKTTRGTFCFGTNQDYLTTHGYDLERGRFFTEEEVERRANVVVLGKDTREALFSDASGLGRLVHINGIPFAVTGGIFALMALVSFVSLFVGGIGIMNIMLVAVTERTREIGVRKALGAPRKAILTQFMIEAVVLTATGGVIGILLGAGISWAIHAASKMPTFVSLWSVIVGLVVSAVVGVFFGLFPAMRASRLDPVDSLRYE